MNHRFTIAAGIVLAVSGLAGAAGAQDFPAVSGAEFGGPLIEGAYVGAPLTRLPRPSELVPGAWGYGTYGVPTVAGIRDTPPGRPTVYVVDAPRPRARVVPAGRPRAQAAGGQGQRIRSQPRGERPRGPGARVGGARLRGESLGGSSLRGTSLADAGLAALSN